MCIQSQIHLGLSRFIELDKGFYSQVRNLISCRVTNQHTHFPYERHHPPGYSSSISLRKFLLIHTWSPLVPSLDHVYLAHAVKASVLSPYHTIRRQYLYNITAHRKPVILLVHGAWHIPLHYRYLIDAIRSSDYTVLALNLVTAGYDDIIVGKTHLDAVSQVREFLIPYLKQGRKAVVIGHSYGGLVAHQAVAGLTLEERSAQGLTGGVTSIVFISALTKPENSRFKPGEMYQFG
ncbi:hypothetical protein GGR53DRAFT_65818 [Hypoxylon sp. FL1150]|nr:hypothetical protein GGR53DRAFT_65818 [Hypoxylon sp. FL1150]